MANILRTTQLLLAGLLVVGVSTARADLIVLGEGMVYDSVQDLTWLQDSMYARSSGFDADGQMTYAEGQAWAANLVYAGYDDWRLPQWQARPADRPCSCSGDSELSKMLEQLGWHWEPTYTTPSGQTFYDYHAGATGPFLNFNGLVPPFVIHEQYWWAPWVDVDLSDGSQSGGAWAVRQGRASVPEPSTLLLLGSGLAGLLALRRRSRKV